MRMVKSKKWVRLCDFAIAAALAVAILLYSGRDAANRNELCRTIYDYYTQFEYEKIKALSEADIE